MTENTPDPQLCLKWSPNGIIRCHRDASHTGECGNWQ